jgi:hypothetical protein
MHLFPRWGLLTPARSVGQGRYGYPAPMAVAKRPVAMS